ncbi:MAG: galactose-1-phosphate uridylyltransferase [Candidatus Lokiarchaeota archaeon]|nr:galactose-1-phosphate uridylyltransferase [Candidatus Lokiarchaeota archaeon]
MGTPNQNEVRFDPILREWVIVAQNRTVRPVLGKTFTDEKPSYTCPFCPDSPEGAGDWVVKALPNRFPALSNEIEGNFADETQLFDFYRTRPGKGNCEVLLYSQDHEKTLAELSISNIIALIELWKERFLFNMNNEEMRYSFIFENRGEIIGVTLHHPHGQMYSFPFIPPRIERAVNSSQEFWMENGTCLFCKVIETEKKDQSRIIEENDDFLAFIPYFAKWPFEIHIYPKNHFSYISQIPPNQSYNFATIIKHTVQRLDQLYGFVMPYVFSHHNAPYNFGPLHAYDHFHYHIEIYPPYRAKDRIKYIAGVEMATHTFINPTNPQENAKMLRDIELNL